MGKRTKRTVAHFPAPFRLASVAHLLPSGPYAAVLTKAAKGVGDTAVRRQTVTMFLPRVVNGRWILQEVAVSKDEIGMATLHDPTFLLSV
ncbi:hypothetical protein ABUE29_25500 [Mesorhizobium sp. ZMM04-4]